VSQNTSNTVLTLSACLSNPSVLINLLCALCVVLVIGCNQITSNESTSIQGKQPLSANTAGGFPDEGTQQMIHSINAAIKNIDPIQVTDYVKNQERANILSKQLAQAPDNQKMFIGYSYALELLKSGQSEKAIAILEDFSTYFKGLKTNNRNQIIAEYQKQLAIAYLRKAEQDNCIANHTTLSCIIPLATEAQYQYVDDSERAILLLQQVLSTNPEDKESQYLLNIAYMTIGKYPHGVPERYSIPTTYFDQYHSFERFTDRAMSLGVAMNQLSGGTCIDDFNNDGYLDIIASSWGFQDQVRIFFNDGTGGFIDHTPNSGLQGVTGGLNMKQADFNNDGYLDFIILRGAWLQRYGKIPNSLIRNNGDGTFSDITLEAGMYSEHPTQTAEWADFNLDGHLDVFIGNESIDGSLHPPELYINQGDGSFLNKTREAGITNMGFFKGITSGDFDNDGDADIYISNFDGPNMLLVNQSQGIKTKFAYVPQGGKLEWPLRSFSTWTFDYNNDGKQDIFVSGYSTPKDTPAALLMAYAKDDPNRALQFRPMLYKNKGELQFEEVSLALGLKEPVTTMGCNFGDLDNDGYPDFYLGTGDPSFSSIVPNKMYHNQAGERFLDVTFAGGFGHIQKGHAIGFGDLDADGDQDIYAVMGGAYDGDNFQNVLFENPMGNQKNWITLVLKGTKSNSSAIGAKICLTISENGQDRSIYHTVGSGASFGGNSLWAEMGIGDAREIQKVSIKWPNRLGDSTVFRNVPVNRFIRVIEGRKGFEILDKKPVEFSKRDTSPHQHPYAGP